MQITWVGSPNFDKNRTKIDRVVIHWFGVGKQAQADAEFQKANGTSAHYSVEDGNVHQYVKEEHVAYHAGNYAFNQRSIGIEHSAEPTRAASDATYETSGRLIAEICGRQGIPIDRTHIIKHSEVPRATQCPGTIDIDRLINIAKNGGQNMPNTYKGLDLSNAESMKIAVDLWDAVVNKKEYVKVVDANKASDERAVSEYNRGKSDGFGQGKSAGYQEGYEKGKSEASAQPTAPVNGLPQPINLSEWDQNGLTYEVTNGDTKTILNYKKK